MPESGCKQYHRGQGAALLPYFVVCPAQPGCVLPLWAVSRHHMADVATQMTHLADSAPAAVNLLDDTGSAPLHHAISQGNAAALDALLKARACIERMP